MKPESVMRFRRLATAAAFASLFSYAAVLIVTQSLNNQIRAEYDTSFAQLGWLAPAMMTGFFAAVLVGGHYSDRIGKLPVLLLGCASMSAGASMFGAARSFGFAAVGMLVMGVGGGFSEGAATALITDLCFGPRRSSMMNLGQAAFGVGAVVVPLATGSLLKLGIPWRAAYFGTAALCLAAAMITLASLVTKWDKPAEKHGRDQWRDVIFDPLVLMLSVGILLYVGAELGQSNWTAVYFHHELHATPSVAAKSLSTMWLGIMTGRLIAAALLKILSEYALLCWTLVLGAIAESALLLVGSVIPGLVTTLAIGLFFGPVWPTIVSRVGAAHPSQTGFATGIVVAIGSLGAAIFPPLIGTAADAYGIRRALWICVAITLVNFALFLRVRAKDGVSRR